MDNPSLTVALAMAAGVIAQALAQHARLPGIVLLLAVGVLLGPDLANAVRPETLGQALPTFVGFAVAVILFEGGLHMDVRRPRSEARVIQNLVTLGALVTAAGGAVAAAMFMGWDWRMSTLFGTLVIVTGPTVITPLVRRLRWPSPGSNARPATAGCAIKAFCPPRPPGPAPKAWQSDGGRPLGALAGARGSTYTASQFMTRGHRQSSRTSRGCAFDGRE